MTAPIKASQPTSQASAAQNVAAHSPAERLKRAALQGASTTTIKAGDTLTGFIKSNYPADAKGVTGLGMAAALAYVNGLSNPDKIQAGAALKLPKADALRAVAADLYVMSDVLESAQDHNQALNSVLQAKRFAFPDGTRIDVLGKEARVFTLDGKRDDTVSAKLEKNALVLTAKSGTTHYPLVLGTHGWALKGPAGLGESASPAATLKEQLNAHPFFAIKHGAVDDSELRFYGNKLTFSSVEFDDKGDFKLRTHTGALSPNSTRDAITLTLDDGNKLRGKLSAAGLELDNGYSYRAEPDWFSA